MPRVIFRLPDGRVRETTVAVGTTLLEAARAAEVAIEGACSGCMACATCHVWVDETWFPRVGPPGEEEDELLDLAPDVGATSRLACQIRLDAALDGLTVTVPASTLLE